MSDGVKMYLFRFEKKGFTLIELLVVIAIIALLVSILLPSLKQAKELAKKSVCLSNLKNLSVPLVLYAEDNDGVVLPSADSSGRAWWLNIPPYIEDEAVVGCRYPDRPKANLMMCPANEAYKDLYGNVYAVGYAMNNRTGIRWSTGATQWQNVKLCDIVNPAERFFLADSQPYRIASSIGEYTGVRWWSDPSVYYYERDFFLGRKVHPGDGADFLWVDGHASYEKYEDWETNNDWDHTGTGWWTLTLK